MRIAGYITLVWILGIPACENHRREVRPVSEQHLAPARVGLYDSRALAVAYCDSDGHKDQERRLKEALEKARQSGKADQIRQADRALWEARKRMHRQAFSTYPVDDILRQYPDEVDRIKREENLTALISRWDAKMMDRHRHAERVDITERLVHLLTTDERRRLRAMQIINTKPIPPVQYEVMLRMEAGKHY